MFFSLYFEGFPIQLNTSLDDDFFANLKENSETFRFRSKLPVVSNLTAMNLWDGVCMFFIYASFIEFILVNYLARWVQDPEQQKKKKENAILDVSMTL